MAPNQRPVWSEPVAARAALQICLRFSPTDELRKDMDGVFGNESRLPLPARREYTSQSPPANAPAQRRESWNQALSGPASGRFAGAVAGVELRERRVDVFRVERDDCRESPVGVDLDDVRAIVLNHFGVGARAANTL